MLSSFQLFRGINITQRQAVLIVLALYFLGAMLVTVIELIIPTLNSIAYSSGGYIGMILFGGAFVLYYKHTWEPARYLAATAASLLVGLFLPEPFVSQYAPMAIIIPAVLALILTETLWVILNASLTIGLVLMRAGGTGVYAHPSTLTMYIMIVGGLLVSRLIAESSARPLKQVQETIKQSEPRFHKPFIQTLSRCQSDLSRKGTSLISILTTCSAHRWRKPSILPVFQSMQSALQASALSKL